MKEYEPGKTYLLSFPSDGMDLETRQMSRYPIALPVKFIEKKDRYIIVVEPKGSAIALPYNPRWNQSTEQALFQPYDPEEDDILEESDKADELWKIYTNPEEHRWYFDLIRHTYKKPIYADWECGWKKEGIELVLGAASLWFNDDHEQEYINACCDIALLLLEDDHPGWYIEVPENEAQTAALMILQTVDSMFTFNYTVKAGNWDLEERKFKAGNLEVDIPKRKECFE